MEEGASEAQLACFGGGRGGRRYHTPRVEELGYGHKPVLTRQMRSKSLVGKCLVVHGVVPTLCAMRRTTISWSSFAAAPRRADGGITRGSVPHLDWLSMSFVRGVDTIRRSHVPNMGEQPTPGQGIVAFLVYIIA